MEQLLINIWIVIRNLLGGMGKIKLDRPAATGFEVDEPRSLRSGEEVARMGLAVQQLLGGTALFDRLPQGAEGVIEQSAFRLR